MKTLVRSLYRFCFAAALGSCLAFGACGAVTAPQGAVALDGTAPDASSALYEGPFAVGETVTIRAIALRDDWFDSAVAELQVVRGPWTFGEYLEMPEQTFSTSGDAEWVRAKDEGEGGEGSYALRSGAIGDSQESVLSMKVQGAGTVTFKYRVSSQAMKPNGAKVKIVSGGADITESLDIPAAVNGVIDLSAATVKDAVVAEVLDTTKGAVIELNAANPSLTTAPMRTGL